MMSNNGRAKLTEECGEALQVIGKIDAMDGDLQRPHWDGSGALKRRFEDEIADLMAACVFNIESHGLDDEYIQQRAEHKYALFNEWHADPTN